MPDPRHGPGTDTRGGGPEGTGSCSASPGPGAAGPARYSPFNAGIVGGSALGTLQREPGGPGGAGKKPDPALPRPPPPRNHAGAWG